MIDLQAVFCAGAWAAVVILACAVTEAQGGSRRESLPGVPDSDYRWLRALRNRLSHENRSDPEITIEDQWLRRDLWAERSEEHTSELQSLMRISYAVFCLKKKK